MTSVPLTPAQLTTALRGEPVRMARPLRRLRFDVEPPPGVVRVCIGPPDFGWSSKSLWRPRTTWWRVPYRVARRCGYTNPDYGGWSAWTNGDKTRTWNMLANRSEYGYAIDLDRQRVMRAKKGHRR